MSLQKLNQPISRKSVLRIFSFLLIVSAVAVGGRFAWQKYKARPLTLAETKEAIRDYLEEQAGVNKFNPTQIEERATNKPDTNAFHAADEAADSKKLEQKKKKKPRSEPEQLARDFRRNVKEASDYKTIYRLIGENLARVDQLLALNDPVQTESALLLAAEATRTALDGAVNAWLASRIAEVYLWPNIEAAPTSDKGGIDAASLLDTSEDAFKAAGETDNIIRNYRILIARGDRPSKTDKFRLRLAKLLESQRHLTEALSVLHEIQDTNNPSVVRRIASVEAMLQQPKPAN